MYERNADDETRRERVAMVPQGRFVTPGTNAASPCSSAPRPPIPCAASPSTSMAGACSAGCRGSSTWRSGGGNSARVGDRSMASMVRAVVLRKPKTIELEEFPTVDRRRRRAPAHRGCGICGSDYEQYEGAAPLIRLTQFPVIPGHEPLGVIEEIGARARERWGVAEGDRVAVRSGYGCGTAPPAPAATSAPAPGAAAPTATPTSPSRRISGAGTGAHVPLPALPDEEDGRVHPRARRRDVQPSRRGSVLGGGHPRHGARRPRRDPRRGERGLCCVIAARAAGAARW